MPEEREHRTLKRGLLPYRPDSIAFKFGDYINKAKLPTLPKTFGHVTNVPPTPVGTDQRAWGMLGNDQYGDCVMAGAAHETMLWAMATKRPVPYFAADGIVQQYFQLSGGTDSGLDMTMAAKWRRDVGLTDGHGRVHKVKAYTEVNNVDDLLMAAYLFGAAGLGLEMPDSAERQFRQGHVWDEIDEEPSGGHYVPVMGLNRAGNIVLNTWNNIQAATRQFVEKYMMVGVAYFSEEYLLANGLSPELINEAALEDDLSALTT